MKSVNRNNKNKEHYYAPKKHTRIRAWVNIYITLFVAKLFLKNEEKKIKETAPLPWSESQSSSVLLHLLLLSVCSRMKQSLLPQLSLWLDLPYSTRGTQIL